MNVQEHERHLEVSCVLPHSSPNPPFYWMPASSAHNYFAPSPSPQGASSLTHSPNDWGGPGGAGGDEYAFPLANTNLTHARNTMQHSQGSPLPSETEREREWESESERTCTMSPCSRFVFPAVSEQSESCVYACASVCACAYARARACTSWNGCVKVE